MFQCINVVPNSSLFLFFSWRLVFNRSQNPPFVHAFELNIIVFLFMKTKLPKKWFHIRHHYFYKVLTHLLLAPPDEVCPKNWVLWNGNCYNFEVGRMVFWEDAEELCKDFAGEDFRFSKCFFFLMK